LWNYKTKTEYIIQWLIIVNIATAIYQKQKLSKYAFWFVPIFLVTVGLTRLYEKIELKYIKT